MITPHDTVLFQGDSITDGGRNRDLDEPNRPDALGRGYAHQAAAMLLADHPAGLRIYNRGISGNKVPQLAERWDEDCLALQPTVLSILIGINDYWHMFNGNYGGTPDDYEKNYDALLNRTKQALPDVKLVICEPFFTKAGVATDRWVSEIPAYQAIARRLAEQYGAVFVPFQSVFDEASQRADHAYWASDGVHPSAAGHMIMARAWVKATA